MWVQPRCPLPTCSLRAAVPTVWAATLFWCCHLSGPHGNFRQLGAMTWALLVQLPPCVFPSQCSPGEQGGLCVAGTLGAEWPIFPQMRRPLDLPLQPLACPSSPHHQPPMRSLPQPEERVTENRRADPFLQEKPSSHRLDMSPQRLTVDRPPPATEPPPKTHVGNSGSRRGQAWRPCVLWGLS